MKLFEIIEMKQRLLLVMELVRGVDMHCYLKHQGRLSENEAQGMSRQLVSTVQYCHQKDVVHRDLKPENMLLDSELNVKITGFGLKKKFTGRKPNMVCGNISYVAPQSSSWAKTVTAPE